jgi:hypothetical protein
VKKLHLGRETQKKFFTFVSKCSSGFVMNYETKGLFMNLKLKVSTGKFCSFVNGTTLTIFSKNSDVSSLNATEMQNILTDLSINSHD